MPRIVKKALMYISHKPMHFTVRTDLEFTCKCLLPASLCLFSTREFPYVSICSYNSVFSFSFSLHVVKHNVEKLLGNEQDIIPLFPRNHHHSIILMQSHNPRSECPLGSTDVSACSSLNILKCSKCVHWQQSNVNFIVQCLFDI